MQFIHKCALRKENVPVFPCDCKLCDWFINHSSSNNCFWNLADFMDDSGYSFSFDKIAEFEGISVEEVMDIYTGALEKLRKNSRALSQEFANMEHTS